MSSKATLNGTFYGEMPDPTAEQIASPEFEAIWQVIRSWDVGVPEFYRGYCGANGSHVALILNALDEAAASQGEDSA